MTGDLPEAAISIRQPWAWAILHGGKNVENRSIAAASHMPVPVPRRMAVHASKTMTGREYSEAATMMAEIGVRCPLPGDLPRGGIVGSVSVHKWAWGTMAEIWENPWYTGPRGLVLSDPVPLAQPIPAVGQLGFFWWARKGEMEEPKVWMTKLSYDALEPHEQGSML